jgi:hypothetical protein
LDGLLFFEVSGGVDQDLVDPIPEAFLNVELGQIFERPQKRLLASSQFLVIR